MNENRTAFNSQQLHGFILNFGEQHQLSRAHFETELPKFEGLVRANGGLFESEQGDYELGVFHGSGFTVMSLNCVGGDVALAVLATEDCAAVLVWDELVQHHARMLRKVGREMPTTLADFCPQSLPWAGVSVESSYLEGASAMNFHNAMSILWIASFAILSPQNVM
jgi:hypothetical protein